MDILLLYIDIIVYPVSKDRILGMISFFAISDSVLSNDWFCLRPFQLTAGTTAPVYFQEGSRTPGVSTAGFVAGSCLYSLHGVFYVSMQ